VLSCTTSFMLSKSASALATRNRSGHRMRNMP
jgi:hypothetical protein